MRRETRRTMNKRQIGRTGAAVNEIGYGGMGLSIDAARRPSDDNSVALLKRIVDELGVELIDTADSYSLDESDIGHNERLIARALEGERRNRVTVATKGGFMRTGGAWIPNGHPEHLRSACEQSLRALATDRIDLYQLHRPDPTVPFAESIGALADLQREGKIISIGVSNVSLEQLVEASSIVRIESVQNVLAFVFYDAEKHDPMLEHCERESITFFPYAPLGGYRNAHRLADIGGFIDDKLPDYAQYSPYQLAIAWLLKRSKCIVPIPGSTRFEHVEQNMAAASIDFTDEAFAILTEGPDEGAEA
jgi:aryl-alcohol dehydrogenase-like predicted oxidoreductase